MRCYLVRHADPDYANDSITAAGHAEAAALGERLRDEGVTQLFASPMGRAQATAAHVAEATGLRVATEDWTAEWGHLRLETRHGQRCLWDIDGEELRTGQLARNPLGWAATAPLDHPGLEESYLRMAMHSDEFFQRQGYRRLDARYAIEQASTERLVLVCHGGFGLAWLSHLLGVPLPVIWSSFWLAPSSVTVLLWDQRSDRYAVPRALCIGDTSHLARRGHPVRPRGIKANFD